MLNAKFPVPSIRVIRVIRFIRGFYRRCCFGNEREPRVTGMTRILETVPKVPWFTHFIRSIRGIVFTFHAR